MASPESSVETAEGSQTDHLSDGSFDSSSLLPDADELAAYDSLMRTRMPSIQPVDLSWMTELSSALRRHASGAEEEGDAEREDERLMTKAEKQNAKKKRRKERERAARVAAEPEAKGDDVSVKKESGTEETVVAFKLFSDGPVKPVSITRPVETYPIPLNPRHQPMPTSESSKMRRMALSSAAGWDLPVNSLFATAAEVSSGIAITRSTSASVASVDEIPTIRVGPTPSSAPTPNLILILPPSSSLPPPPTKRSQSTQHQPILRIPRLPDAEPASQKLSHRQRRHLPRVQPYDVPPARFWAPEVGLGGKARGYAYGWRGSEEGRREGWAGYVRS